MQPITRSVHVFDGFRSMQKRETITDSGCMSRLNSCYTSADEEIFESLMLKTLYHVIYFNLKIRVAQQGIQFFVVTE